MDDVKKVLRKKRPRPAHGDKGFLSTGSTLLNLAITGHPDKGFACGHYYYVVGDSKSGKTFLTLTCLAEAAIDKRFDKYRFIFDDAENGALMDFRRFFGKAMADRVEPPRRVDGKSVFSRVIEDFYFHLDDAMTDGRPFIYVLDSLDSLSSDYEGKKFQERKKASRKGTKAAGDYGDGKAKANSSGLRNQMSVLRDTGSILIVIGQTRDNIGASMFEPKKTRSGGRAPTFYATAECWASVAGSIKKKVKDKDRIIGNRVRIHVRKNRVEGKDRMITIPIYYSVGFDDIGGCVDYLIEEGHWRGTEKNVQAGEYEHKGSKEKLIRYIEENGLEPDLRQIVTEVWNEIESECVVRRKSRYG